MCIPACVCDESTSRSTVPVLYFDSSCHSPPESPCQKNRPRERTCANKGCGKKFRPPCYLMIFCSRERYENSGIREPWESLCLKYPINEFKRLRRKLRKKKYLQTDKGKIQHRTSCQKSYHKKKAAKLSVSPDGSNQTSIPISPSVMEETEIALALPPPPVESSQQESVSTVETRHQNILNILFSGKTQTENIMLDLDDAIAVPVGVVPRCCKRPGCAEIVISRSPEISKKFCSKGCVDAIRNTLQTLRAAFKATRCHFTRLLILLLKVL